MRNVEIKIFMTGKTMVLKEGVDAWLRHLGASENYLQEIEDILMDEEHIVTDPALLIALAAKRCYMSFEPGLNPNVNKVRKDWAEYLENILKSGHGSVLEHACYTFAIEGVSRVFTGEMNRHRAGVGISEGSMRYIRYTDIPFWMPDSIKLTPSENSILVQEMSRMGCTEFGEFLFEINKSESPQTIAYSSLIAKKLRTQALFKKAFTQDEENYNEFQEIWKEELAPSSNFTVKKHLTSCGRRIIPMGVATGGTWTMNMRAVRHILALRASAAAEEEILHVFTQIGRLMVETEPMLFADFKETPEGYFVPTYPKV